MTKHTVAQVEDMIATEDDAEVSAMLRAYADLLAKKQDNGTTHYAGCIQAGPKHYECALAEISRLRLTITHLRAELEKKTAGMYEDGYENGYQAGMAEKKEWVGLTDDEIEHLRNDQPWWMVRDIEAKLKEKNGE